MTSFTLKRGSLIVFSLMSLLMIAGCTGLGGEPAVVAVLPTPEPVTDVGYPQQPPDLVRGAAIYAENCTQCHGVDGRGDGALVLSGQVMNPGNFRDPTSARGQYPRQWFDTITNGKLEKLMPPWANALSEQARWDVALYTYTMHYTADQLALGEALYQDCAECHGISGQGNGPEAAKIRGGVKNLTSQRAMITLEDSAIYTMVVEGSTDEMPAYGDKFNEEERWAVVAYARTLSLANTAQVISTPPTTTETHAAAFAPQAAQAEAPPAPAATFAATGTATISGTVTNGTVGSSLPDGLNVALQVFRAADAMPLRDLSQTMPLAADGTFRFENVLISADNVYITVIKIDGRSFASELFRGDPLLTGVELPIIVYDLSDDPSLVTMTAAVSQIEVVSDRIEVQYAVRFENRTDRVFSAAQPEADGRYKSVWVNLPPGALIIGIDNEPRYIISADGLTVWDTVPLVPGEERFVIVSYLLDYGGGAILEYTLPFAFDGQQRVLIRPETISLTSQQFTSLGVQRLVEGGLEYQGYGFDSTLPAETVIQYELSGQAADAAVVEPMAEDLSETVWIPLLGVLLGIIALIVGAFILMNARRASTTPSTPVDQNRLIDSLIAQIAELDEQHQRGELNHDVYRNRRNQLKQRLAALMDQQKPTP